MHLKWTRRSAAAFAALPLFTLALTESAKAQRSLPTDTVNIAAASRGGRIVNQPTLLDNQKEYGAENLIDEKILGADGKGSYGWVSNRFDHINMEEVVIGFKDNALKTIGRVVLNPSSYVARERWAKDIALEVSVEGIDGPYQTVAELTLKQTPDRQEFKFLPVAARFVKLRFRTNYGSDRAVALGEVEIYEAIDTSDGVGATIGRLEATIIELENWRKSQMEAGPQFTPVGAGAANGLTSNVNLVAKTSGGKIVGVSSVFESERGQGPDAAYNADKLIDGKTWKQEDKQPSNGWSSNGFAPGQQWVILGFKEDRPQPIGKIVINPMSYQPRDRWARRIEVQVSNQAYKNEDDLKAFRTIKTLNLKTDPVNQEFDLPATEAKYVRLVFTANGPGGVDIPGIDPDINSDRAVSLGEVEIYPPKILAGDLDAIITKFRNISTDLKNLRRTNSAIASLEIPDASSEAAAQQTNETPDSTPKVTSAQSAANTRIKTARTPTTRAPSKK